MKIADKMLVDIPIDDNELKFILWNTLIQLSTYCDDVDVVEEESFNIEQMLVTLEDQLNIHQTGVEGE